MIGKLCERSGYSGSMWLVVTSLLFAGMESGCEDDPEGGDFAENPALHGIVNGEATNYEKWKGVVSVCDGESPEYGICTGSFISPDVILTAGHCVYFPISGLNAVTNPGALQLLGGSDLSNEDEWVHFPEIEKVVKHPDWKGMLSVLTAPDLALIKLAEPVENTEVYGVRAEELDTGIEGVIVGYGLSDAYDPQSSGVHRAGDATILEVMNRVIEIAQPAGLCQGDSGGPFLTEELGQWVVTGVTSVSTTEECDPSGGGYGVNVKTYRDWIDDTMREIAGYGLDDVETAEDDDFAGASGSCNTVAPGRSHCGLRALWL